MPLDQQLKMSKWNTQIVLQPKYSSSKNLGQYRYCLIIQNIYLIIQYHSFAVGYQIERIVLYYHPISFIDAAP